MSNFDKKAYDIKYRREHKARISVDLNIDEMNELNKLLDKNNMKKAEFIRWAIQELKKKGTKK